MNKTIKAFLLLILFSFGVPFHCWSQNVGYNYKALSKEACTVRFNVIRQDTAYFIITTVMSNRMTFLNNPTMKIRTFKDSVLTLSGNNIGSGSTSAGIVAGNVIAPITSIYTNAQFPVTPEVFELLRDGVAKIRLSMMPINHERVFKKDKIGGKLYELYLKVKEESENF